MDLPAVLLHHDGSSRYVSQPYPRLGETVELRVRVAAGEPVRDIMLRTTPDGENAFTRLTAGPTEGEIRWWSVSITMSMPVVNYRFLVVLDDAIWWYNGLGMHDHNPTDYADFQLLADYDAPRWVADAVFYQIFPDRFADGDAATNPRSGEWIHDGRPIVARRWDEQPGKDNPSVEFYGGDLRGLVDRLPYLADLGVNALYLTPIFTARSVHRYDVTDYYHVDPHLGGDAALAELRNASRALGIKLMLDIVPNHCGVEHPWFVAAQQDADAPTAEYFIFTRHPGEYATWLGVRTLPKLDYRSKRLRDVMFRAPDAVFRWWLQPPFSIDAWRVDVANMLGQHGAHQLGDEVVRELRAAVKGEKRDAYLLGENFFDATDHLQGDEWDANMNYSGFTRPVWQWLGEVTAPSPAPDKGSRGTGFKLTTRALVDTWAAFRAPIPWVVATQQFNLVDSHDTARIGTIVGLGSHNPALHRVAATLQLTYPGVPCIFYGDENGMEGSNATAARAPMEWDTARWDWSLHDFYRRLIDLRRTSPALRHGGFQVLLVADDTLVYLRDAREEQIVVVAHRGPAPMDSFEVSVAACGIGDGTSVNEVLTGASATVSDGLLRVPAQSVGATVWRTMNRALPSAGTPLA